MAAGVVHIPWYATLFRGDAFEAALKEFAPTALRYGGTEYRIYRSRDDMYKFLHMVEFEDKAGFEAYWYGPEFNAFRAETAGWYQVPVLYVWNDLVLAGGLEREPTAVHGSPAEGDTV
jgi:quinol monooxygenase YgiN